jgi:glutaredoxin 3
MINFAGEITTITKSKMTDSKPLVNKSSDHTSEELDIEGGYLSGAKTALKDFNASANITVVTDLDAYDGSTLEEKVDSFILKHSVVVISKSYCAFCRDVKDLLASRVGVKVHIIEVNVHPDGTKIHNYIKKKTGKATVPVVFIRGKLIGGCDDVKTLHVKGDLEQVLLKGLINRPRTTGTDKLETSHLIPVERSRATHPLFWFPNTVNNYVIRVVGFQVCTASVLSCVFLNEMWARYLAAGVLVDFCLRFVAGSSASPFGMIATLVTSPFRPQFRPGPPKQFASLCGIMFSGLGTLFYFVEFRGHQYVGCAFMAGLAGASGLEWAIDFCLGCKFFAIGIYMGLLPDHVYRIYTSTRQEVEDSWDYMFIDSGAAQPEKYDADPSSPIALRYKKKSDEWSKDDFDFVRHMQVNYFAMPLGLSGLAVAFKIASNWSAGLAVAVGAPPREYVLPEAWSQAIALAGAVIFVIFLSLYAIRAIKYPHKIATEYDCPLRSPGFGTITINLMLFAFLLYDEINFYPVKSRQGNEEPPQMVARVFFWIGAIAHTILTVVKFGEWIARRMELEHIHTQVR